MRPLARAKVNLLFNAGFYGCLAVVALAVLLAYGSSLIVALPTAGGILVLWVLTLRWMRLGPAEPQMEAASPAPEDAPIASTKQQLAWLAGVSLVIALPFLGAILVGGGWLFQRLGERLEAEISFAWWYVGMMTAFLAGVALQSLLMARWIETWERERGVRLFTELWPLRKRPVMKEQTSRRRRSRYYKIQTGTPAAFPTDAPKEELPEPLSATAIVVASFALGACALATSGILGESTLAHVARVLAGFGFVLLGVVVLKDWHGIRGRLVPRKGPRLFNVFSGLALFVGGGAIFTGIIQLLGA